LKQTPKNNWQPADVSHPVRVRGLKQTPKNNWQPADVSHPVRVRGLKHAIIDGRYWGKKRRTPCGCVG